MNLYHIFDIETDEWHFDKLSGEVAVIVGDPKFSNTAYFTINESLCKDRYFLIDADKYPDASRIEKSVPIPAKILAQAMSDFKQSIRHKMKESFIKCKIEQGIGYGKIIKLSTKGVILAEFDSYKQASQELKMSIGTVKTKVRRAALIEPNGNWSKRRDFILCKEYELQNILKVISETDI